VKSPTNPVFKVEVQKKNYFFIKELKKSTPFIFGRATRISRTIKREEEGEGKKQEWVATYHLIKKISPPQIQCDSGQLFLVIVSNLMCWKRPVRVVQASTKLTCLFILVHHICFSFNFRLQFESQIKST
jgi:hypothetical protein